MKPDLVGEARAVVEALKLLPDPEVVVQTAESDQVGDRLVEKDHVVLPGRKLVPVIISRGGEPQHPAAAVGVIKYRRAPVEVVVAAENPGRGLLASRLCSHLHESVEGNQGSVQLGSFLVLRKIIGHRMGFVGKLKVDRAEAVAALLNNLKRQQSLRTGSVEDPVVGLGIDVGSHEDHQEAALSDVAPKGHKLLYGNLGHVGKNNKREPLPLHVPKKISRQVDRLEGSDTAAESGHGIIPRLQGCLQVEGLALKRVDGRISIHQEDLDLIPHIDRKEPLIVHHEAITAHLGDNRVISGRIEAIGKAAGHNASGRNSQDLPRLGFPWIPCHRRIYPHGKVESINLSAAVISQRHLDLDSHPLGEEIRLDREIGDRHIGPVALGGGEL